MARPTSKNFEGIRVGKCCYWPDFFLKPDRKSLTAFDRDEFSRLGTKYSAGEEAAKPINPNTMDAVIEDPVSWSRKPNPWRNSSSRSPQPPIEMGIVRNKIIIGMIKIPIKKSSWIPTALHEKIIDVMIKAFEIAASMCA